MPGPTPFFQRLMTPPAWARVFSVTTFELG
jgi:hypothetical protein